jgi:hypothetical protein
MPALVCPPDPAAPDDARAAAAAAAGHPIPGPACRFHPPAEPVPREPSRWLGWNIFLILVIGISVLSWIYAYTDLLAGAITVLSLGGVLSWLAFFVGVLPEDAKKSAQTRFYEKHLTSGRLTPGLFAAIPALWLLSLCFTTVEVTLTEGSADRSLEISRVAAAAPGSPGSPASRPAPATGATTRPAAPVQRPEVDWVAVGGPERFLVGKWPFSNPQLRVKLGGYPSKVIRARAWHVEPLRTPGAFDRRVILLRPSVQFLTDHSDPANHLKLFVTVGGKQYATTIGPRAIWVGCDQDVAVPEQVQRLWFDETKAADHPRITQAWLKPRTLTDELRDGLPPEDPADPRTAVTVEFIRKGGKRKSAVVDVWTEGGPFPQVVDIDETK